MNKKTIIYVVRHGQSSFNLGKTKDLDSALTDNGKMQAHKVAIHLKNINFDLILSSKLKRAKQTAEIVNKILSTKLITEKKLEERSPYLYASKINMEDTTLEEKMLNKMKDLSSKDKMNFKFSKDMESPNESVKRVFNILEKYIKNNSSKNILLVSHGNLMQSILTYLEWCKYDELPSSEISNTDYFVIEAQNKKFKIIKTHGIEKQKGKFRIW